MPTYQNLYKIYILMCTVVLLSGAISIIIELCNLGSNPIKRTWQARLEKCKHTT